MVLCGAPGIPARGPSGASAHLRAVANALGAAALVTPLEVDRRGEGAATLEVPLVTTGRPPWPRALGRWRDLQEVLAARRVADAVLGLRPDLLWERHALYSDAGQRVHEALGVPWILEVNAPPALERARWEELRQPTWARRWERRVLGAAPLVVAVSAWLADWCREQGARRVLHVPNGVLPHGGDRATARARLGIAPDTELLGFLGSGRVWHGVDALPALLDARPYARLLVVGEAEVRHPRALHVGVVTEAAAAHLVAAMDAMVAPYPQDAPAWTCPLKLLHARAQGTPVLATAVGDVTHLLGLAGAGSAPPRGHLPGGTALARWSTEAACDALDAWRGQRAQTVVRSWDIVVREVLDALNPPGASREE